jgi:hypothetical protein
MDFVDAVKLIARRWLVFFAIFITVGVMAFAYVHKLPAKYKATSNIAFVGPSTTAGSGTAAARGAKASAQPANPLNPTDVSLIVHDVLASVTTQLSVQGMGDAGYSLTDPTSNQSPVMTITSTSTSPGLAVKTVNDLISKARNALGASQARVGAGPANWNQLVVVTGPSPATRQSAGKTRAAAAFGILAVLLATFGVFIVDNVLTRRQARLAARRQAETESSNDDGAVALTVLSQPQDAEGPQYAEEMVKRGAAL